ncbi:Acetyl-hydrolase [Colletotrichum tanaceti]|uniref:Acetyl-hydrolase n=1 Tax=Colletotrichum tanaceti TaxID=1306861 RepID=A0A4U6XDJ9_9PEZI|nr:Acetyl-hydrolase [Colletotrichum tanaceti]TKW53524.1 Acetyl-hydrolase [Colletotrichum tanaceti]
MSLDHDCPITQASCPRARHRERSPSRIHCCLPVVSKSPDAMSPKWSQRPLRLIYILLIAPPTMVASLLRIVFLSIAPRTRPNPRWSFRQSFMVQLVKTVVNVQSTLRWSRPLSLLLETEGDRFVVVPPADKRRFHGPCDDEVVRPGLVGTTWTPPPVTARARHPEDLLVVLHLHGGAYVVGAGRDADMGFGVRTMLRNMPCTHVCSPQYRLSGSRDAGGRFPAALQDAVSSYAHLLHDLNIPASRIVLSGGSAGGNIVLALLRYIATWGAEADLPWPRSALLWSPWADVAGAQNSAGIRKRRNYATDLLPSSFIQWGAEALTGNGPVSAKSPWISPMTGNFRSGAPIWVQTCTHELLFDENLQLVEWLREAGSDVEQYVVEDAPHDPILLGDLAGFEEEAVRCAKDAARFLERTARR